MKKLPFILILLVVSLIVVVVNTVSVYNAVLNKLKENTAFHDQLFLSEVADNANIQFKKIIKIAEIIGFQLNNADFNQPKSYEDLINGIIKKDNFIERISILAPVRQTFAGNKITEFTPLIKKLSNKVEYYAYSKEENSDFYQEISIHSDTVNLLVRVDTKFLNNQNVVFLINFNIARMLQLYKYRYNENFDISVATSNGKILASSNDSYKNIDINSISTYDKFKFQFSNSDYYVVITNNISNVESFVFPHNLKLTFLAANLIIFLIFVIILVILFLDKRIINRLEKKIDFLSFELSEYDKQIKVNEVAESDFFNELAIKRKNLKERTKNEN